MSNSGFLVPGKIGPVALGGGSVPWYLAGGAPTPIVVYQPKGAASLAASYINVVSPGTYDAAPGTAPSFATATGWTFAAASLQYLTTGYTPGAVFSPQSLSAVVRIVNATAGVAFGALNGAQNGIRLWPINAGNLYVTNGAALTLAGGATSTGVIIIAGGDIYINGADVGNIAAAVSPSVPALPIGVQNFNGSLGGYFSGTITHFALYGAVLSPIAAAAVSAAVAAL